MHLGNLRTALYTFLLARKLGGKFILRIEDTDRARFVVGATDVIFNTLRTCGLSWDEGPGAVTSPKYAPYVQSERQALGLYGSHARQLVESGAAYYCFCKAEESDTVKTEVSAALKCPCRELDEDTARKRAETESFVIRQRVPLDGVTKFSDEVYGDIEVPNADLDDQVLIKSDGYPTYNFANVVDDHAMDISHVVRGCEYLSSTPKYTLLYQAFGWQEPAYIHVQQIMRDATHKLSKRDGDAYFDDFYTCGFLPEAIINYIALLLLSQDRQSRKFSVRLFPNLHFQATSQLLILP